MLIEHPVLKDAIRPAHLETTHRLKEADGQHELSAERFQFVIDTNTDEPLATVTDKYTLVQNSELVSALDVAADERGIILDPIRGEYVAGKSYYDFTLPGKEIRIGTDPSPTRCTLDLRNDYRGEGGLALLLGWFRMKCTNGLIIGEIASNNKRRHVGEIDPYEFVSKALDKAVGRFETERIIAETLAEHAYQAAQWRNIGREAAEAAVRTAKAADRKPELHELILADTPERYHDDLDRAVRENTREIGDNLWALAQAVAEVATHRMQQRVDGSSRTGFNAAADTWATRQNNRVRQLVGVRR